LAGRFGGLLSLWSFPAPVESDDFQPGYFIHHGGCSLPSEKLPFLFVGWFWYLGTLIPVIGLIQVGEQAMADRYTYLPSIGIAILVAWGISHFVTHEKTRRIVCSSAIIVLLTLSGMTFKQCGYWKSSFTLFNRTLNVTKNNYIAHNNFGLALLDAGFVPEAIHHFNKAIRIKKMILFYTTTGAMLIPKQAAIRRPSRICRRPYPCILIMRKLIIIWEPFTECSASMDRRRKISRRPSVENLFIPMPTTTGLLSI